jgi:hypothetical protein
MLTKKEIVDNILHDALVNSDKRVQDRVEALLHQKYAEICMMYPWQALRRKLALDFSTASSGTGVWIPANLAGIEIVMDETNKFEILPRDRADVIYDDTNYRYYTYVPDNTALFEADDCYLSHQSSSFTSADLTSDGGDNTGEYVRFASQRGYYLLTGALAFSPQYNGPDLSEEHFEIRPKYSQKMVMLDTASEAVETGTVQMHYWETPIPLYDDSDVSILPTDEVLELAVLGALPEAKTRRPVTLSMQENALSRALSLNPSLPRLVPPRDRQNQLFRFDRTDHYSRRR